MRTLVAYESMFGNTHAIAAYIAEGLLALGEVEAVSIHEVTRERLAQCDLFVVGGPTHVHGLTSSQSRKGAADTAAKSDGSLLLDPDAEGPGLRDWFHDCPVVDGTLGAAFDTRYDANPLLTGRASRRIARRLGDLGFEVIAEPESFLVDKDNTLLMGERERARAWGAGLAHALTARL